jgi:predicted ATPase
VTRLPNTLIGRAEEVLAIDRTLSALGRGGSAAIEVAGEPGIGKTRLLAELATRADALGYLVLSGSASELDADLPFWVFVDALDEYIAGLEPRRIDALENDVLSELGTVFPAVTPRASMPAAIVPQTRYRTYRAVRELLERLTAIKPLVLVLDDVHWADPASVEPGAATRSRDRASCSR